MRRDLSDTTLSSRCDLFGVAGSAYLPRWSRGARACPLAPREGSIALSRHRGDCQGLTLAGDLIRGDFANNLLVCFSNIQIIFCRLLSFLEAFQVKATGIVILSRGCSGGGFVFLRSFLFFPFSKALCCLLILWRQRWLCLQKTNVSYCSSEEKCNCINVPLESYGSMANILL